MLLQADAVARAALLAATPALDRPDRRARRSQLRSTMSHPEPAGLAAYRPDLADLTRDARDSLLEAGPDAGLTRAERLLAAAHAAAMSGAVDLTARYTELLGGSEVPDTARRRALITYAERLTAAAGEVTGAHLAELHSAGLSTQDIVALSQLVAYVAYEARVTAGLRALEDAR
jgi:uncharacterized protein YciW